MAFVTEKKEVEQTVITDVLCNVCGASLVKKINEEDTGCVYGIPELKFQTGYLSEVFPDGYAYTFSLCEACIAELMDVFKIEPEKQPILTGFPGVGEEG